MYLSIIICNVLVSSVHVAFSYKFIFFFGLTVSCLYIMSITLLQHHLLCHVSALLDAFNQNFFPAIRWSFTKARTSSPWLLYIGFFFCSYIKCLPHLFLSLEPISSFIQFVMVHSGICRWSTAKNSFDRSQNHKWGSLCFAGFSSVSDYDYVVHPV